MIATEQQIIASMQHWENEHVRAHGPLNGRDIPPQCAALAELLGTMWFKKEQSVEIPPESPLSILIINKDHA